MVTTETGQIQWIESYRGYGQAEPRVSSEGIGLGDNAAESHDNRLSFTGHESDGGSVLTYMKARYYDPLVGRFYSNDPVGYTTNNPTQSFSRYLYVNNNPYRFSDSDGLFLDIFVDVITTAIEGGEFLGTAAAYAVGKVTGNETLADMASADLGSEFGDVALALGGTIIVGVPSALLVAGKNVPNSGPSIGDLRAAKKKDAHHIVQDAAVRDLPGYKTNAAPGIQLPGGGRGTPHHAANQVQRQSGGGTYAAERRIGYKALRRAGVNRADARSEIERADAYFESIGVGPKTSTRIPGNRR